MTGAGQGSPPREPPLPPREALTNVRLHAPEATLVRVRIDRDDDTLTLTVTVHPTITLVR